MNDISPVKIANRTGFQALIAFVVSGTALTIWNTLVDGYQIDKTIGMVIATVLTWLASYLMNAYETKHDTEILPRR